MALKWTAAVAVLMMSSAVYSAVTIKVPEEIKLLAVNEQEVGGFLRAKDQYKINPGASALVLRYSGYYQHADNSHDILRSAETRLTTPSLKDGETYRLALINAPKDFDEAQKYKDEPVFGLYDQKNNLITQQAGSKGSQKNWFSENVLGNTSADLTKPAVNNSTAVAPSLNEQGHTDQKLIQLWQQSSKQERQKFMAWLAEQTN